ncbi:MAG: glycyl-radical enzyme activating protein [Clostridia bacterium]|nr:glycyl-radical enzyme activating protein [Clostridia bacterium]
MTSGMIFNIQRFSIYDGPGARTTVFFKGCNLKCKWCHNPESISAVRLLEFYPDKCIGCGRCFEVCPAEAHKFDLDGAHIIDRDECIRCMKCADSCFAEALIPVGEKVTVDKVVKSCLTDMEYYKGSGGGVTFSGGECMQQIDFLCEILKELKANGVHTAIDTAGHQPWEKFEKILPYADMFLYDVKAATAEMHRTLTGVSNELILENLKKLSDLGKRIWIRVPYIPGFNSGEMEKIADILKDINFEKIEIMPFHRLGEGKYAALGIENPGFECKVPGDEEIDSTVEMFRSKGLNAYRS